MDDALEEWITIQANMNQDYFSLEPTNHTSLEVEQPNTTSNDALLYDHYSEPEQLRQHHPLQPDSEHESSETETEEDVIVSDQEIDTVHDEATGGKKPWPVVWWKFQLDNLFKYFGAVGMTCKPFWGVSVVAAMVSFVVLRKRVFGTKHKGRTITTGVKRETQFATSTVQLNQTLSVVRRIPVIKILPSGGDANPWAIVPVN